jgi:hypothetical protein
MNTWLAADVVAQMLRITDTELAQHLLSGALRFRVQKSSPGRDVVLFTDVVIDSASVDELEERRWGSPICDRIFADGLINRAALKHGLHPTRHSPGVRGPARRRRAG